MLAGWLINRSDVIEYETKSATGTVAAHHMRMFFTVFKFSEFSSFSAGIIPSSGFIKSSHSSFSIGIVSGMLKVGPLWSYIFIAIAV